MKQWKKLLRQMLLIACICMLAGCGAKDAAETPDAGTTQTQAETGTSEESAAPDTEATATPKPTSTPKPTATPKPTKAPTPTPAATATPVPTMVPANNSEKLTGLDAFGITSRMIVGWNLGNTLDSHGNYITYDAPPSRAVTSWNNEEPTKEVFETVKAAGFNTVRIPITWYNHIKFDETTRTYTINPEWLDYVKKTVDYAYELDMFVIINVHHENWVNVAKFDADSYENASRALTDIWNAVATAFAEYDQHLIFEGLNEPRQTGLGSAVEWGKGDTNSRNYINNLNQVFVDTVRSQGSAANAERLLMIPGYCASSDQYAIRAIKVPENGGNIALSVHAYFPYNFTMATGTSHAFPGTSGYDTSISTFFKNLTLIMKEKGVPIIIGETGASDFENTEDRARWGQHFFSEAKNAGVPCVLWDNQASSTNTGESFGLLKRTAGMWYESAVPMLQAIMEVYGQESSLPVYKTATAANFDWAEIPIESDWVEIFRAEEGLELNPWGNKAVANWKPYMNENYEFVLVYYSKAKPYMVLQGGWHKVHSTKGSSNPYMITFTYENVQTTMQAEGAKLDKMNNFYISAESAPMTAYGLYAVPVK